VSVERWFCRDDAEWTPSVSVERWFCRDDAEWTALVERLKLTPCPHCRAVGTLIRHGVLTGFDDSTPRRTVRARRVFCSNRHRRRGCGRTISVWSADKIRRLSLTTRTVWTFLKRAVAGTIAAAIRATNSVRSERTLRRVWTRFRRAQTAIRTALLNRGPPPAFAAASTRRPAEALVLDHLQSAFPQADCPVAAFQAATRSFFL
jgi:hypothetical protein